MTKSLFWTYRGEQLTPEELRKWFKAKDDWRYTCMVNRTYKQDKGLSDEEWGENKWRIDIFDYEHYGPLTFESFMRILRKYRKWGPSVWPMTKEEEDEFDEMIENILQHEYRKEILTTLENLNKKTPIDE